jgi:hypothetical protein
VYGLRSDIDSYAEGVRGKIGASPKAYVGPAVQTAR